MSLTAVMASIPTPSPNALSKESVATSLWVVILVAAIPAAASVIAAAVAARYAHRARVAEATTARLRDLENRIDERKYGTYRPMLDLLRDMLSSANQAAAVKLPDQASMLRQFAEFSTWITVFGSDEAVVAFRNMMQASFHDPPAELTLRIMADFMVAARRDMGYVETTVTALDILAIRIKDVYDQDDLHAMATASLDSLAAKHQWTIPWQKS